MSDLLSKLLRAFFCVLSWRRFARDLALPVPGVSTPRRVIVAALVLGIAFACFNQLGVPLRASHGARVTADEPFYLLTAVSLLEDGDLDLTNDYELRRYRAYYDHPRELWHQSAPTEDGRLLSPHNVGLPVLILPAYAVAGMDGVKHFLAALGGLVITFTALLAYRATGNLISSLLAAAILGASSPLFVYSAQIYPEAPGALVITAALWVLLGRRRDWLCAVLLGLSLTGLVWLGTKYAVVGSVIAMIGLIRLRPRARVVLLAFLVPGALFYAWFHLATFGGLTPYAVNRLYQGESTVGLIGLHLELWNRLYRLIGLWIDGEFGLVRWVPVLLLALLALPALARRGGPVRWALPLVFGAQFLVATFFTITMRGWWFPGRMLIVVLPLLAIPLAHSFSLAHGRRWFVALVVGLCAYTLGITLALRDAGLSETIVLAVDPFALPWLPFQGIAGLFPVYTDYQPSTWILTAAWVLVAMGLAFLGRRLVESSRTESSVGSELAAKSVQTSVQEVR